MKKKEILIVFILAVLVTLFSCWWYVSHPKPEPLPFPYGSPSYEGILHPFGYHRWWLPPFIFAFWFLMLISIWLMAKAVVEKIRPEKIELDRMVDTGDVFFKKQLFLIFIASILLMFVLNFVAYKIFGYPQEVKERVSEEIPLDKPEEQYCQGEFLEDCAGRVVKIQGILQLEEKLVLENPTIPSKDKKVYLNPDWIQQGFINERVEVIGRVGAGSSTFPCLGEAKIQPSVTREEHSDTGKIACTTPTSIGVEQIKLLGAEEIPYLDVDVADLTPEYDKKRVCLYGEFSVGPEHQGLNGVYTQPAVKGSYSVLSSQGTTIKGEATFDQIIGCGVVQYSGKERELGFGHMGMYPYLLRYDILIVAKEEKPFPEKIGNQDDCQKIQGKVRKDICFWDLARLESNPNICQLIRSEEIKSICFLDLAHTFSNPKICDFSPAISQEKIGRILQKAAYGNYNEQEMSGATMRDFCYAESEPKELSWCAKINPIGIKAECLAAVAKNTGVESVCDQINNYNYTTKKFCYAEVAVKKNDLSVCEKLPGVFAMGECFAAYALLTGDRNVCDRIKDSNNQKVCRDAVAIWYE